MKFVISDSLKCKTLKKSCIISTLNNLGAHNICPQNRYTDVQIDLDQPLIQIIMTSIYIDPFGGFAQMSFKISAAKGRSTRPGTNYCLKLFSVLCEAFSFHTFLPSLFANPALTAVVELKEN